MARLDAWTVRTCCQASGGNSIRRIISTLLIAAAAMLIVAQGASAAWKCTAYGKDGVYGWGTADDKGAAGVVAMLNCAARGGGCRITGCEGSNPVARPTQPVACPQGQQRGENGKCYEAYKKCPNGERIPTSRNCPTVVEYKRCENGERVPVSSRCPKKEPVVEYKRCPNGERVPVSSGCPQKEVEYKHCSNGERVPVSSRCPEKTCLEGQRKNAAGDCYTVSNPTTPDPPRPTAVKINCNLGQGYPSSGDLPRSIYEIKIGSTSLFAGGYADLAPNRNDCKGVTTNGCYLRVTDVPKVNGGTGQACVQFCKAELCPKTTPPQEIAHKPDPPPIPQPVVVPKPRGKPAVLTLIAPPYVVPKPRGKPAALTLIAPPYVVPKPRGKPAVLTVTAAPYVVPAPAGKHPGAGYELFFDGKLVSGPDAASYSLAQARENCAYNNKTKPNMKVECRYDGEPLGW